MRSLRLPPPAPRSRRGGRRERGPPRPQTAAGRVLVFSISLTFKQFMTPTSPLALHKKLYQTIDRPCHLPSSQRFASLDRRSTGAAEPPPPRLRPALPPEPRLRPARGLLAASPLSSSSAGRTRLRKSAGPPAFLPSLPASFRRKSPPPRPPPPACAPLEAGATASTTSGGLADAGVLPPKRAARAAIAASEVVSILLACPAVMDSLTT